MMEQPADTSHPLVGTWKLVSFHVEIEGSNEQQLLEGWDEHPVGFVIFTKDGRMLGLLTAGDRIAFRHSRSTDPQHGELGSR
jgi:hypothetical protein